MLVKELKYSYNDVCIVPAIKTHIQHRSEVNPFNKEGMLPIFSAPMDTVVGLENFELLEANKINVILPRNINIDIRKEFILNGKWVALSLNEFHNIILTNTFGLDENITPKVLIDVANGHMSELFNMVSEAKEKYNGKITIMIGNIANPLTYREVVKCGADYVRCSIGTGSGCITSSNTAIHYPIASLIDEMVTLKNQISEFENIPYEKMPKIIADGGIRNYSDVIKALALGADYVMIGGLFSSFVESPGELRDSSKMLVTKDRTTLTIKNGIAYYHSEATNSEMEIGKLTKVFYGMASKRGQTSISGTSNKTAEGIEKVIEIKYNTSSWVDNMISYLRSAMSYTDTKDLEHFKQVNLVLMSNNTFGSVNR